MSENHTVKPKIELRQSEQDKAATLPREKAENFDRAILNNSGILPVGKLVWRFVRSQLSTDFLKYLDENIYFSGRAKLEVPEKQGAIDMLVDFDLGNPNKESGVTDSRDYFKVNVSYANYEFTALHEAAHIYFRKKTENIRADILKLVDTYKDRPINLGDNSETFAYDMFRISYAFQMRLAMMGEVLATIVGVHKHENGDMVNSLDGVFISDVYRRQFLNNTKGQIDPRHEYGFSEKYMESEYSDFHMMGLNDYIEEFRSLQPIMKGLDDDERQDILNEIGMKILRNLKGLRIDFEKVETAVKANPYALLKPDNWGDLVNMDKIDIVKIIKEVLAEFGVGESDADVLTSTSSQAYDLKLSSSLEGGDLGNGVSHYERPKNEYSSVNDMKNSPSKTKPMLGDSNASIGYKLREIFHDYYSKKRG